MMVSADKVETTSGTQQESNGPVAELVIPAQFDKPEMCFPIQFGSNWIGRSRGQLHIQHDFVSALHAQILVDGCHWIEDNQSTNGTYFGDNLVSLIPHRFYQLKNGDRLRFGRTFGIYSIRHEQNEVEVKSAAIQCTQSLMLSGEPEPAVSKRTETEMEELTSQQSELTTGSAPPMVAGNLAGRMMMIIEDSSSQEDDAIVNYKVEEDPIEADFSQERVIGELETSHECLPIASVAAGEEEREDPICSTAASRISSEKGDAIEAVRSASPQHKPETVKASDNSSEALKLAVVENATIADSPIKDDNSPTKDNIQPIKDDNSELAISKDLPESPTLPSLQPAIFAVSEFAPGGKDGKKRKRAAVKPKPELLDTALVEDLLTDKTAPVAVKSTTKRGRPTKKSSVVTENEENCGPVNDKDGKVRVLFTGIEPPSGRQLKVLQGLGMELVDSWKSCTHLVTDKIRRTTKFLCALSSGKRICSTDWIAACQKAKQLLDTEKYPLKDSAKEKQFAFSLQHSMDQVKSLGPSSLMANYKFLITPSVQPDFSDMREIIEASGGEVLHDLPMKLDDRVAIIGCQEDGDLLKAYTMVGWSNDRIMSTEFILSGTLRQQLDWSLLLAPSKTSR